VKGVNNYGLVWLPSIAKGYNMNFTKWTCCGCGDEYTEQTGDTEERMCDECLNHEDINIIKKELDPGYDVDVDENGPFISKTVDYGPPYSMANPTGMKTIKNDKSKLIKLVKMLGWDYYRLSSSGKETYDKITDILETKNV